MEYTLKNEFYEATVSTLGAELTSLKNKDGRELLWHNPETSGWQRHAPLLFPFCGRLKDSEFIYRGKAYPMTIHGFASTTEFTVKAVSEREIVLVMKSDEITREIFPFDFLFTAVYSLEGDRVNLKVTVENTGSEILPYVFGWHPGFNLPTENGQDINDYAVKLDGRSEVKRILFKSDLSIPSTEVSYPLQNGEYRLSEKEIYEVDTMVFRNVGTKVKLYAEGHPFLLDMSWSDNLDVLCIWKMPKSDAKYICLEPWTHHTARGERSNDIEVRPMIRLESGKSESYEYTLKFSF